MDPFRGDPERPATMNRYLYAHAAPTIHIDQTSMAVGYEGAECQSFKSRLAGSRRTYLAPQGAVTTSSRPRLPGGSPTL